MENRVRNKKAILFTVIALFAPSVCIQSRSVNLALETSFLFDPQDIKDNATFINKVQNVLDKLKTVLEPPTPSPGFLKIQEKDDRKSVLTEFLSQIGSALIKFDNNDIRQIANDLRDAVLNHASKNKGFNELFEDERLRAFIKNTVKNWADTDPMTLKVEIAKRIINVNTDSVVDLIKMLNKVFDASDEPKFKKLSKQFAKATKTKDYTKFLTKTIDFVIFKRYKKQNFLLKHIIKDELKKFTKYVVKTHKEYTVENNGPSNFQGIPAEVKITKDKDSSESNERKTKMVKQDDEGKMDDEEKDDNQKYQDRYMNYKVRARDHNELARD